MSEEIISRKTRTGFRNFLGNWTLQEIADEFEAAGIECDKEYEPGLSGARKSLVEQYYHSLDLTKPSDVRKLLSAYEGILNGALQIAEYDDPSAKSEDLREQVRALTELLEKDGFAFRDGRLTATNSSTRAVFSDDSAPGISEVTRRNLMDAFLAENVVWNGRLSEAEFIRRLFDLGVLPIGDSRLSELVADIQQHRVRNDDWDDDWIWRHRDTNLLRAPDQVLLRFLSETIHPVVRPDLEEVQRLLQFVNGTLSADGWELAECARISGRPVFAARRLLPDAAQAMDTANTAATRSPEPASEHGHDYDVALSFAGEDRTEVEPVATALQQHGVRVFYAPWETADLWGRDLYQYLAELYRDRARYCIVFASSAYARKAWPTHELRAAQARALREASEYILPVRLDDTELPGVHDTVMYLRCDIRQIVESVIRKLGRQTRE